MDEMTCPQCRSTMSPRSFNHADVLQCDGCQGMFLPRASLASLVDAELSWHRHRSSHTMPIPKITEDMTAPPPKAPPAQSFLDTLFRG